MTTTEQAFEIRRIEPADEPLLVQFYRAHFPHKAKLNNHPLWQWEFKANPFAAEVPFFVIRGEQTVRGGVGGVLSRLQVDGECLDACHPVDFFVEDDCKGFAALRLFRKIMELRPVHYASYVSDDAEKLFKAAGFLQLNEHVRKYFYALRPDRWLPLNKQQARSLAVYAARRWFAVRSQLKLRQSGQRFEYQVDTTLQQAMVPALDAQCRPGRIGLVKDLAFLRWRYEQSPAVQCRFFSQTKNGVPNCLVVVHDQPVDKVATILDVVRATDDPLEIAGAVQQAIAYFRRQGYRTMGTTVLSAVLDKAFGLLGFSAESSNHRFMFYSRNKELKDRLNDPARWDFNLGDTDVH